MFKLDIILVYMG